jgi:hypothetical protein
VRLRFSMTPPRKPERSATLKIPQGCQSETWLIYKACGYSRKYQLASVRILAL